MESKLPCEMIECVPVPSPESCRMSSTSMRRATTPLIKYSLSPERYMRLVTATSSKSTGSVPSELSSTRSTSAMPTLLRADDPAKMTSSIAWPRRCFALRSPSTHSTASEMFDLPEPFGPTTAMMPGSSASTLRSANDLKPLRTSDFRYMERLPLLALLRALALGLLAGLLLGARGSLLRLGLLGGLGLLGAGLAVHS